jgi:hypothetical protein
MRRVATLHIKQYGEYSIDSPLQAIAGSQSKIMSTSSNSKLNSKSLQIPSKGLRGAHSHKKHWQKISLDCPELHVGVVIWLQTYTYIYPEP